MPMIHPNNVNPPRLLRGDSTSNTLDARTRERVSACQQLDIARQFLELSIIQSLFQAQLLDELYVSRGTGPTGTVLAMIQGLTARISGRSLPTSAQRYRGRRTRVRLA